MKENKKKQGLKNLTNYLTVPKNIAKAVVGFTLGTSLLINPSQINAEATKKNFEAYSRQIGLCHSLTWRQGKKDWLSTAYGTKFRGTGKQQKRIERKAKKIGFTPLKKARGEWDWYRQSSKLGAIQVERRVGKKTKKNDLIFTNRGNEFLPIFPCVYGKNSDGDGYIYALSEGSIHQKDGEEGIRRFDFTTKQVPKFKGKKTKLLNEKGIAMLKFSLDNYVYKQMKKIGFSEPGKWQINDKINKYPGHFLEYTRIEGSGLEEETNFRSLFNLGPYNKEKEKKLSEIIIELEKNSDRNMFFVQFSQIKANEGETPAIAQGHYKKYGKGSSARFIPVYKNGKRRKGLTIDQKVLNKAKNYHIMIWNGTDEDVIKKFDNWHKDSKKFQEEIDKELKKQHGDDEKKDPNDEKKNDKNGPCYSDVGLNDAKYITFCLPKDTTIKNNINQQFKNSISAIVPGAADGTITAKWFSVLGDETDLALFNKTYTKNFNLDRNYKDGLRLKVLKEKINPDKDTYFFEMIATIKDKNGDEHYAYTPSMITFDLEKKVAKLQIPLGTIKEIPLKYEK